MAKIVCPCCNTPTPFTPIYLTEKHGEYGFVVGTEQASQHSEVIPAQMQNYKDSRKYAILECQACNTYFLVAATYGSNWSSVYPLPHEHAPEEYPQPINSVFEEASLCFAIGAYIACVGMCQIALESMWRDKSCKRLDDLVEKQIILPQIRDRANEIRLWGNVIKHEPFVDVVSKENTEQLLGYLKIILNSVYVEPSRLAALRQEREKIDK